MLRYPYPMTVGVVCLLAFVAVSCSKKEAVPEPSAFASTPSIYTDPATGCQYLQYWGPYATSLTPRLNIDGKPMCGTVIEKSSSKVEKNT